MDKNFNRFMTKGRVKGTSYAEPKIYHVEWTDAVTDNGWEVGIGTSNLDAVSSIGYLLYKDKDKLLHTNRRISIPNKWIINITEI